MSTRKEGKPTAAAALARPAAHNIPPTPGVDHAPVQEGDVSERAPAANLHRPRPASSPRVGQSRSTDPSPFDDPSNYLG